MYLLFSKLKFTTGIKSIESHMENVFQKYMSRKDRANSNLSPDTQPFSYEAIIKFFEDVRESRSNDFYIPSSYIVRKIKGDGMMNGDVILNGVHHYFVFNDNTNISVDQLIYNYWDKSIEVDDLNMLELLFK
jgi:hypothetical protein